MTDGRPGHRNGRSADPQRTVTTFDRADAVLDPAALMACTVNMYRPGTRVTFSDRAEAGWTGSAEVLSRFPAASTINAVMA